MKPETGQPCDIDSWMALVRQVSWNFPGLETQEQLQTHKQTVLRFMQEGRALCAKEDGRVVGVLLLSKKHNMICCLAVAPDRRRRGIASALLKEAIARLNGGREISVTTFRADDPKGDAPRALYRRFGFEEGELCIEQGYPMQRMARRPGQTGG